MKYDAKEITSALNDLLTRNYDAVAGYKEAANGVKRLELKKWMWDNLEMRDRFITELKNTIVGLGAKPERGTSFLSGLHRIWIDLKSDASDEEGMAMLEECQFGEKRALEDYKHVMNNVTMPTRIKSILRRQYEEIEATRNQLNILIPTYEDAE